MARPKMTDADKAAAKAKRDAAKAEKAAPVAAKVVAGSNSVDRDQQNLARNHRDKYVVLKEAQNKANRALQGFGKKVKADGLTMRQIKLMVELMTPEGEAAYRASVINDLVAAQWAGAEVGSQLQLFMEPDRTPAVDRAYEEGAQDCMDGKAAKPSYDPATPQHFRYMEGFHDESERRIKAGIGSDVKPNPTRAEVLQAAREKNAEPEADKLH